MAIRSKLNEESIARFWEKVRKTDSCWIWEAARNEKGYGVFGVKKETDKAHRIAWMLTNGKIEGSLFVLHRCDNPPCVNPAHLFLGTNKDNVDDMIRKGRNSVPPKIGGWNKKEFSDEINAMIGKIPDNAIAKMTGVNKSTIRRKRIAMGIESVPCATRFKKGSPHPRWTKKGV